ncbi:MAG TPA: aspartate aminotransferase family protein [Polyangiaceae bacterium]|nr:aspartate aminotransferase family protein [Polyangiaceae bacterium]
MSPSDPGSTHDLESFVADHEQLGRAMVDLIGAYVRSLDEVRVCPEARPADLEALFREPLPRRGQSLDEVLAALRRDVLPNATAIASPRYFGLFNPTPLPIGVWVDALCSALNQNGAAWRNSPAASTMEARAVRWLCELVGFEETSFGTLTSGGSEANLLGLKLARDHAAPDAPRDGVAGAPLVVYASEQCHYSLGKSVDILGMGRANLRRIETDDRFHVRLDALRRALDEDAAHPARRPCCIVGVAGATSTGVVDPLDALADVAAEYGVWFHVDAAYGGALAFSDRERHRLRGIARADSVTIDPHKWMALPFACGALLVRGGARVLRDAFDSVPDYLSEQREGDDTGLDFFRYGQLGSRRANAFKLWAAMRHLGVEGYARIVDGHMDLTRYLAQRIDALPHFERVGEVETAVCCARFVPPGVPDERLDGVQHALQQRVERSGRAWFATTVLRGRRVLRINVNSVLTARRHVDDLVEVLEREAAASV